MRRTDWATRCRGGLKMQMGANLFKGYLDGPTSGEQADDPCRGHGDIPGEHTIVAMGAFQIDHVTAVAHKDELSLGKPVNQRGQHLASQLGGRFVLTPFGLVELLGTVQHRAGLLARGIRFYPYPSQRQRGLVLLSQTGLSRLVKNGTSRAKEMEL